MANPRAKYRITILALVFVLVCGAFVNEHFIARPQCNAADERVEKLATERLTSVKGPPTQPEVEQAIGRKPTVTKSGPNGYAEKYVWIGGLPWRQYYIWVLYSPEKTYMTHIQNLELDDNQKPDYKPPVNTSPPPANAVPQEPLPPDPTIPSPDSAHD